MIGARNSAIAVALVLVAGCSSVKTGLFRTVMMIAGDDAYSSGFIALEDPRFISAEKASYLKPDEEVIGVSYNGVAKAYPLTMSFHHHIFNDKIAGKRILVTFCPLTHTAMAFDPTIDGKHTLTFAVGRLEQSNMTMVDESSGTSWVQLTGEALDNAPRNHRLRLLFALHTTWSLWKQLHPNTLVLSRDTGYFFDYSRFPFQKNYFKYKESPDLFFPVPHRDERYHPKEMVLGVEVAGVHKAYPFTELNDSPVVNDSLGNAAVLVLYDAATQSVSGFSRVLDGQCLFFTAASEGDSVWIRDSATGSAWSIEGVAYAGPRAGARLEPLPAFKAFWFAWANFYPETLVYAGDD